MNDDEERRALLQLELAARQLVENTGGAGSEGLWAQFRGPLSRLDALREAATEETPTAEPLFPYGEWPDVWHALSAIHTYDSGDVDGGVRDESLRERCTRAIDEMYAEAERDPLRESKTYRYGISRFVRDTFLTDEALAQGYGASEAASFFQWVDEGDYRRRS